MRSLRQLRSSLMLGGAALVLVVATCVVGYRAQSAVPYRVRQLLSQQGVLIEPGSVSNTPFSTVMRGIKFQVRDAPFVTGRIDELKVGSALLGSVRVNIQRCQLILSGDPSTILDGVLASTNWSTNAISVADVNVEYSQRVFGKLSLAGVRVERNAGIVTVNAAEARLGRGRWRDVLFSVHRRNQMIEIGVSDASPTTATTQIGYFPSARGGGSQWTVTFVHQPVRPMAQRLGWELGAEFDATSAAGSLSFVVPREASQPIRGLLQMIVDRWPRPKWPESEALLGGAGSFLARIVPSDDLQRWELVHTDVSLSLFTMTGTGRILFGPTPSVAFDVQGTRTCAQIQGNTPPSTYLDRVNHYLEQAGASVAERRATQASLRLQVFAENGGKQNVAWRLEPACGLSEMTEGSFISLELPPKEDAATN
ncbi:MAG: hypothetical protein ACM3ZE_30065 [Myxococcales bacterium]